MHGGLQPPGLKHELQHLSLTFLDDFQYGFSTCEVCMMARIMSRARAAAADTGLVTALSGPGPGRRETDSDRSALRLYKSVALELELETMAFHSVGNAVALSSQRTAWIQPGAYDCGRIPSTRLSSQNS